MSSYENDDPRILRAELNALRARLDEIERGRAAVRRYWRQALVAGAVLCVSMGGVALAANGDCPNGLPFCFAPNTPALASQVNQNFAQLKEWLEQKVGPTGTSDVTIGNATVAAASIQQLTANTVNASAVNVSGAIVTSSGVSASDIVVPNNTWPEGAVLGTPGSWDRSTCSPSQQNRIPSGSMCPNGQYVCGLYTDHVCGDDWFRAAWSLRCCKL